MVSIHGTTISRRLGRSRSGHPKMRVCHRWDVGCDAGGTSLAEGSVRLVSLHSGADGEERPLAGHTLEFVLAARVEHVLGGAEQIGDGS